MPTVDAFRRPPITFAHGGASAHAPAHSAEAFRLALRLGATGIHSAAWLTADGVAVLDAEGRVRSGLRRRSIGEVEHASMEGVVAVADLYAELGTDFELSIEVADGAAVDALVSAAGEADQAGEVGAGSAARRLWLGHREVDVLAEWRERHPDVHLVNRTRLRDMRHGPERRAAQLAELGIDAVNLHYSDWTGGLTTLFHRFERLAFGWDAQHTRIVANLVRMGIDGVSGDQVDRLVDGVGPDLRARG